MADFLASDEFCGDGTLGLQCWGNDLTVTDDFKRYPPPLPHYVPCPSAPVLHSGPIRIIK